MPRTAVIPAATTLCESESQQRQQQQQEVRSPCTPPLQSIEQHKGGSSAERGGKRNDIFNWSPQTPESLPVVRINDIVKAVPPVSSASAPEDDAVAPAATMDKVCNGASGSGSALSEEQQGRQLFVDASEAELVEGAANRDAPASKQKASSSHAAATPASPCPLSPSPPTHIDPQAGPTGLDHPSSPSVSVCPDVGPSTADGSGTAGSSSSCSVDHMRNHGVFFRDEVDATVAASLFFAITSYCDLQTLVQLMRVCRASHQHATSDTVWKPILADMNLSPLLAAYDRSADYYAFFLQEIVTTRALHGHYTFQAANNTSGSHGSVSNTSGSRTGGGNRDHIRDDDSLQEDVFNIASLQLLISAASLGQSNHLIGRVQLLLTYKNDSMEVLQGACRFSVFRRCFSLCCSAFGTVKRGPVFTVAVATVTKPWANEGFQHFCEHKNGIRLVMTPVLWEGQSPGSQITEKDILVVSRPRPEAAAATSNASTLEPPTQSRG